MIENRIKGVKSKENSVCIMFRAKHIVILFAVFLCANAFPAAPEGPAAPAPGGPGTAPEGQKQPEGQRAPEKSDLDTDATSYWRYSYYGPRWGYGPDWDGRTTGWGFGLNTRAYNLGPYGWY